MAYVLPIRDDKLVDKALEEKEGAVYSTRDFSIIFPERFLTVGLASFTRDIELLGLFIIDDGKSYGLINFPIRLTIPATTIEDIAVDGKPYKKLSFEKGEKVLNSLDGIPNKDDLYLSLSEFIIKSNNIPFYVHYEDLVKFFIKGSELTGINLGKSMVDIGLFVSIVARDESNNYIRELYSRAEIIKMDDIEYLGLTDFDKGLRNVASLISGGAYLNKGLTSALTMENPPETDLGKVISK